jgi:chorismate synthase
MGAAPFAERPEALVRPRPGHADLAGGIKYDRHDLRDVLERASARETAARVACGAVAKKLLAELGVTIASRVVSIAGVVDTSALDPATWAVGTERYEALESSELRALDTEAEATMKAAILAASHAGDTVGGVVECAALGLPVGLGSHVHWDRKLDGRLAQAAMSIHAIKAVEIGDGWAGATRRGSEVHDAIGYDRAARRFTRASNPTLRA